MSGAGSDGPFKFTVDARNDQYDPDDDRWLGQVATLFQALDASVDLVTDQRQAPGAKGAIYAVTHVDVIPKGKDEGTAVVEDMHKVQEDIDSAFKETVNRAVAKLDKKEEVEKPTMDVSIPLLSRPQVAKLPCS